LYSFSLIMTARESFGVLKNDEHDAYDHFATSKKESYCEKTTGKMAG
jgi:hypothetical protein